LFKIHENIVFGSILYADFKCAEEKKVYRGSTNILPHQSVVAESITPFLKYLSCIIATR